MATVDSSSCCAISLSKAVNVDSHCSRIFDSSFLCCRRVSGRAVRTIRPRPGPRCFHVQSYVPHPTMFRSEQCIDPLSSASAPMSSAPKAAYPPRTATTMKASVDIDRGLLWCPLRDSNPGHAASRLVREYDRVVCGLRGIQRECAGIVTLIRFVGIYRNTDKPDSLKN